MRRRWTSTCIVEVTDTPGPWPSWTVRATGLDEDHARALALELLEAFGRVRLRHDHKSGGASGVFEEIERPAEPANDDIQIQDVVTVGDVEVRLDEVRLDEVADAWAHGWTMAEIASEWELPLFQARRIVRTAGEVAA